MMRSKIYAAMEIASTRQIAPCACLGVVRPSLLAYAAAKATTTSLFWIQPEVHQGRNREAAKQVDH